MKLLNNEVFDEIEKLKWLPFVGDNYFESNLKILIIGESHYYDPNGLNITAEDRLFTRWIVNELGLGNRNYKDESKFFKAVNRMLAKGNLEEFWNKISFYNFVQRPMNVNKEQNERPNKKDFLDGWETLMGISKVLKPDYCLFFGNTSANYFNEFAEENKITHEKIFWYEKINGAYLKYGSFTINGIQTKFYFTKHPSRMFSAKKWLEALKIKDSKLIEGFI